MERTSSIKKAPLKTLRVLDPIKTSPFVVPTTTRKEAPTGNTPMGAIPPKAVTNRFPQVGGNQTSEAPGVVFDPTQWDEGVETPPPNDSFQASLSPPVGGRLRSFRRDWLTKKCSDNVLNIITNGYVLPFTSKPNLVSAPLIQSGYKALQKRTSSDLLYPVSPVKERNRKGGKCKISRVLQLPVSCTQASPKVEASNRPKQAQLHCICRKVQNGNITVHQGRSDSRGMAVVNRLSRRLPSHPHPPKLKEVPKVLPQVASVSVHFPSLRTSHGPSGLYNDCKRGEADHPVKGNQTSPVLGRLANQGPVSGRSTSKHSDSGGPYTVLRVDNKSGEVQSKANSGVFLRGLRIPSRFSPCKTHSREIAQTSRFDPTTQVKTCFDCKMFDVANWVACLNGENGLDGWLHIRPFQFHLKEHWRFPQLLDTLLPWTETISAHLDWWQNPTNMMKGADLHAKHHSIQLFTDASNEGWGTHLEQTFAKGLWSDREKMLHINVLELKAVSLALQRFKDQCQDQTVLVATDNSTVVAYINKQGGTHSAEMCALLWKIMTWCQCYRYQITLNQTHARVSECDGRPAVQVEPSSVNRMVTASAGVQTDLSQVVHSSCRSICHSPEPQTSTVRVSSPGPKCLGHRCSEYKLVGSHCLCLSSHVSPSQGDPKSQAIQLPDHRNSPSLARDALILGPSAALNRDPTSTSSQELFSNSPRIMCSTAIHSISTSMPGVASTKNKASLWKWQRELLPLRDRQQGPSTSQSGPYLRDGAEKIWWISPLPL